MKQTNKNTRRALLLFFALTASIAGFGQCTPNAPSSANEGWVSYQPAQFPCTHQGLAYDQTLQVKVGLYSPSLGEFIDSLRIDSITGLPTGITYSISPNHTHAGGSAMCINFYGTTNVAVGDYPLQVHGRVYWSPTAQAIIGVSSSSGVDTVTGATFSSSLSGIVPAGGFYLTVTTASDTNCHPAVDVTFSPNVLYWCPYANSDPQVVVSVNGSSSLPNNCVSSWQYLEGDAYFYVGYTDNGGTLGINDVTVNEHGGKFSLTVTDTLTGFSASDTLSVYVAGGNRLDFFFDSAHISHACANLDVPVDTTITFWGDYDANIISYNYYTQQNGNVFYLYENSYANDCSSWLSGHTGYGILADSVIIDSLLVRPNDDLCMVTVDTATGHNKVIWEKHDVQELYEEKNLTAYTILKLNDATSLFDTIGTVPKDSLSEFIDMNSNPAQQSSTYAITFVQSLVCSDDDYPTNSHTTVHLSSNVGTSGEVNLSWNAYTGFEYTTFDIYRSNNGGAFVQIGNAANTSSSYSDVTPPSGTNRYFVSVTNPNGCSPSRSYSASISNILNPADVTGINGIAENAIRVYPNPAHSHITVSGIKAGTEIRITNLLGEVIYTGKAKSETETISVEHFASGMYFLNKKKFIKQ